MLVAYGGETPTRSRAEMAALTALPAVQSFIAPSGKLAFHEECASEITAKLADFLDA
jgi:hypothetical protein